jgi:asparagine N-glycosylation enzyme membrane subunit Stt3
MLMQANEFGKAEKPYFGGAVVSEGFVGMQKITKREKETGPKEWVCKHKYGLVLVLVLALGVYLNLAFFYGPSWINGSDNYIYTSQAYTFSKGQFGSLNCKIVDCVNYIVVAGVGLFFMAFGYGVFIASLFGILCFSLTVIVIYLIGKELYKPGAGLLAAFFYSIFPLVLSQSSNVGDDIPMALLVTVSVFLVILALKKEKNQKLLFFLAGFTSAINFLSVSEAIIGLFLIATFLIATLCIKRNKPVALGLGSFILGVLLALLIIALIGVYEVNNPLYVVSVYTQNYNGFSEHPAFSSYVGDLFQNAANKTFDTVAFGYFGYALIICSAYLIITKFRKGIILGYWFVFSFLYLGFGSQSIHKYIPVMYVGPRYAMIFVPAICLIAGIALAKMLSDAKKKRLRVKMPAYAFVCGIIMLLGVSSLINIADINYSQLSSTLPLIQFGQYLNGLPYNSTVFGPSDIPWSTYVNHSKRIVVSGYSSSENTCGGVTGQFGLTPGSFLVGNVADYGSCSLKLVYTPREAYWLENYTLFKNWGTSFYSYQIYEYDPSQNPAT